MSKEISELFAELKEIRLEKKLTLKQISQSTRIHQNYLELLEEGNILEIPEIYDKLFFKSYLKALKVSESEYYDRFIELRKTIREDRTTIVDMTDSDDQGRQEFNYKNILYFLPFLIIVLIIWFLVSNTQKVDTEKSAIVKEIKVQDVVEKIQNDIDSTNNIIDSTKIIKQLPLTMNVKAIEKTWFRVIVDKKDTAEYLMETGDNVNLLPGKAFEFLIGKANGIKINFQGKDYGPFGDAGEVVKYMRIDSSGIVNKVTGIPKKLTESSNDSL